MRFTARLISGIAKFVLYGSALAGALMSMIVFVSVAMRYVFHSPLRFTDELVGLLFSAGVSLSIPFLFASDRNIRVSLLVEHLSGAGARILERLASLLTVVFFLILGYLSLDFASFSYEIGARSDVARLPVAPWMALMPFSCFLTALIVLTKMAFEPFGVAVGKETGAPVDGTLR